MCHSFISCCTYIVNLSLNIIKSWEVKISEDPAEFLDTHIAPDLLITFKDPIISALGKIQSNKVFKSTLSCLLAIFSIF